MSVKHSISKTTTTVMLGYNVETYKYSTFKNDRLGIDALAIMEHIAKSILEINFYDAKLLPDHFALNRYVISFLVAVDIDEKNFEGELPSNLPKDIITCVLMFISFSNYDKAEQYFHKCLQEMPKHSSFPKTVLSIGAGNGYNYTKVECNGISIANPNIDLRPHNVPIHTAIRVYLLFVEEYAYLVESLIEESNHYISLRGSC